MRATDYLPHRGPFLFVSELRTVEPGQCATGAWQLTGDEPFFVGHFPGRPTLPGVLMVESLAQLGAVAVLADPRQAGKLPLFGGIERARFRRQVVPGDLLELEVNLGRMSEPGGPGIGPCERRWRARLRGGAPLRTRRRLAGRGLSGYRKCASRPGTSTL